MERIAVQSKDIAIVGYDSKKAVLEVAFRSGGVYQYNHVPSEIYESFLIAPSYGSYFRDHIKDKFIHSKVSG